MQKTQGAPKLFHRTWHHILNSVSQNVFKSLRPGVAKIESRESVLEGGNSAGFPQAQYSYPMTKAEIARVRNGSPGARGRQAKQFMADQECRPAKGSKQKFEVRLDTMESDMRRRFKSFDPFSAH